MRHAKWRVRALLLTLLSITLVFGVTDIIHGPHKDDIHRTYIHGVEFSSAVAFLILAEVCLYLRLRGTLDINSWLLLLPYALLSGVANLLLFIACGGGVHGDGGPLSAAYLCLSVLSEVTCVVAFFGALVSIVIRKTEGRPVLRR